MMLMHGGGRGADAVDNSSKHDNDRHDKYVDDVESDVSNTDCDDEDHVILS